MQFYIDKTVCLLNFGWIKLYLLGLNTELNLKKLFILIIMTIIVTQNEKI